MAKQPYLVVAFNAVADFDIRCDGRLVQESALFQPALGGKVFDEEIKTPHLQPKMCKAVPNVGLL